jgi:hypothetical protein
MLKQRLVIVVEEKTEIFGIYKLFSDAYKRRRYPDMYYIARAILHFTRSRSFTKLAQLASFERRFGNQRLGFLLQNVIHTLGVGAMRELDFDGEQVSSIVPKTRASSN